MLDDAGMVALQLFILAPPLFGPHGERFAGRKRDTVNLWTILFFFSKNKNEILYKYEGVPLCIQLIQLTCNVRR